MLTGLGGIFFALLATSLALLWLARQSRATTGLPAGRLIYSDTTGWRSVERPLFSHTYRLTGRPDYLMQDRRQMIPVEIKSGRAPTSGPYSSHILQLAAYCLLVEETYGRRPSFGIINYAGDDGKTFEINYTPALKEELLIVLDEMRWALAEGDAPRSHDQIARCQACGYREDCQQSLA